MRVATRKTITASTSTAATKKRTPKFPCPRFFPTTPPPRRANARAGGFSARNQERDHAMIRRFLRRIALQITIFVGILMGPGLGQVQATLIPDAATQVADVKCPVTPSEDVDLAIFTDYQGTRLYFCCDRCRIKFKREPDKYMVRLASRVAGVTPIAADNKPAPSPRLEHLPAPIPGSESKQADHHAHADDVPPIEEEHDHKEHGLDAGPRWQKWLGGFHPPATNFPIGVLVAGALAETLFIVKRRPAFDQTARFCIVFAVATGVAAGVLGWFFAGIRIRDPDQLLAIHRWLGTATVLWLIALLWASERVRRPTHPARGLYRFLLFGGTALVLATGFFGGAMVYGLDHYLW